MSGLFVDGFFFHPDGASPAQVAKRIATGTVNPRLDDLFSVTLQETKNALRNNLTRKGRLLARRQAIDAELSRLDEEETAIESRLRHQHDVVAKYQRGEELSEAERELITPTHIEPIRPDKKEAEAELDEHQKAVPKGWEVENRRADDEFVYFTIKRRRKVSIASAVTLMKRVKEAVELYFDPSFRRERRVQYWDRLGTLSPRNPGAG